MKTIIYHGSDHIIEKPYLGGGKPNNDFGSGFYCTQDYELAKEWAGYPNKIGYVNSYELDMSSLKILDLTSSKYSILHWVTILLKNRNCSLRQNIQKQGYKYLVKNYSIDTSKYDVIIGWRADDSYFAYTRDFTSNALPLTILNTVMQLGNLGKQIVLVSKKSFKYLKYIKSESVQQLFYWVKKQLRNIKANGQYRQICDNVLLKPNQKFLMDLIRGGKKNETN